MSTYMAHDELTPMENGQQCDGIVVFLSRTLLNVNRVVDESVSKTCNPLEPAGGSNTKLQVIPRQPLCCWGRKSKPCRQEDLWLANEASGHNGQSIPLHQRYL